MRWKMWQKEMGQVRKRYSMVYRGKPICVRYAREMHYKYEHTIDRREGIVVEMAAEVNSSIQIIPVIDKTEFKRCYVNSVIRTPSCHCLHSKNV